MKPGWTLLGPAFVAAIAYVDPGNIAANVSAGSRFGFLLVWVIVAANVMAGLIQYLSAKLGLVTGSTLPEAVRDRTRTSSRIAYWIQAELVAIATDDASRLPEPTLRPLLDINDHDAVAQWLVDQGERFTYIAERYA